MGTRRIDQGHLHELDGPHHDVVGCALHCLQEIVDQVEELVMNQDVHFARFPHAKLAERVELGGERFEVALSQGLPETHEPLCQGAGAS